ncbi:winged helix-turn-helix transcriptional regulator [Hazenella sp. IB182353]|uniref:ArsR/SmtB family transcription factor n=1 Tax=Polycladospora coralii TaxID=2771432 RepID=UPI001746728E|nr:metalloregulator ArsR/SmtB family transcription factor [Polycladospora coralii]MBS7529576.1 winged helix-turn-helix transcriptional regulator [Polycladospora coralii]
MKEEAVEVFRSCIPLFHALSDPARQDIILMLAQHEHLSVNEIANHATLSRPAISHHLKVLRDLGIVAIHKQGTSHYYYLTLDDATSLLKQLVYTVEKACEKDN